MDFQRVAGVLFIVAGLFLAGGVVSLSTVIYPQYFWYQLSPDGDSASSPSLVSAGSLTLSAKLVYYDASAGVEVPDPVYWDAEVKIYRNSDSTLLGTASLPFTASQGGVNVSGHICAISFYEGTWTVPSGEGVVYKLNWIVNLKDSSGNSLGTQTKTTYAKTADIEPDGNFKINGVSATQTSRLVVTNPSITLEFTPTKNSDKITAIEVEILKGNSAASGSPVTLTKQGTGTYTGSYTLPSVGTYELEGNIKWSGGSPLRRMSIVASWGEEATPISLPFTWSQLAGAMLAAVGVVLVLRRRILP